ncbi:MAG: hypothetical protein BWY91_01649 [bacterium ADurb.BinA028]|nr:MAG: hypothetical protein BWY91_01649 [bacterium ADurb.BinA028]
MSARAVRTLIADPSASTTLLYAVKTAIPGPIAACARSTGAMLPCWSSRSAPGSRSLRAARKPRRVVASACSGRGRQARTTDEASALVSRPTIRLLNSVRIGQVAVTMSPASMRPLSMVSQPVEAVPSVSDSACLKA